MLCGSIDLGILVDGGADYKTCRGAMGISIINSLPSPGAETQLNFPP